MSKYDYGDITGTTSEVTQITYAAFMVLYNAGTLTAGWYEITDATAANGGFGSIYIEAIDSTTIAEDNCYWSFNTNLTAFGWIDMAGTMVPGDNLASISVNGVNQLTGAGVNFATTYTALATAAAANINANAAATVTATTVKERLILYAKTAGTAANGHVITGTGTNFAGANISNMSDGEAVTALFLPVFYDAVLNHVLTVFQPSIDFTFEVDSGYITTTTYNPLYYFRWGSTSNGGVSPFLNAQFYNQNLRFLIFKNTNFARSIFYNQFSINAGTGAVVNQFFVNNITGWAGSINVTGALFNYTLAAQGINISNSIFRSGTTVNLSNGYFGGNRVTIITYAGGTIINLSNSTFTLTGNSTLEGFSNSTITISGVTVTGVLSIRAGERSVITASLNTSTGIDINDSTGFTNTINIASLAVTSGVSINTRFSSSATVNFSNAVATGSITVTGDLTNSGLSMSGCTFRNFSGSNCELYSFTINGGAQNFGANDLIFDNTILSSNTITIPALTSNFDVTGLIFQYATYKIRKQVNNFDGSPGLGQLGTDTLFMRVPSQFVLSNFVAEFSGLVGGGASLQAELQGGTAAGIMAATVIAALNGTVQAPGTAIVPAISGAIANYKVGIAWDYIVIVPTGANLTAGNIVIYVEGFISLI